MNARITLPIAPWDIPDPSGEEWDHTPPETVIEAAQKPVEKRVIHKVPPNHSTPTSALIGRTFMGALNVSDLHYMAMALLQTHDELCELRERVRRLEEGRK